MTPPPPQKSPRASILEAATELFAERGYAGTKMRDIAKAVGVLPGSLYAHIESKEALLYEIVATGVERFLLAGGAVAESIQPTDIRMRGFIKAHVSVVAENPQHTLVVFHQWRYLTGANRDLIVEKRNQYEGFFRAMMEEGLRSGLLQPKIDSKITVLGIMGALNWTPEWFSPSGADPPDVVGEKLADALLWGLLRR